MKWFTVSVLTFIVAECFAMSFNELQDFSNYLREKSLLDQPLKKNPADENDDDDPISDHAWEESGRFEGDLILNDRQRQLIVQDVAEGLSRNGLKDSTKRWPDNEVIFYIQKEHFTSDQVQAIMSGIDDLSRASCVKFRPYKKGDRDAVVVQGSRRGCFSQVGYQGGYQVLNLSGRHPVGRGCFRHGTIVHEFLHTLGFYHMQSSPDRDDYIDVIWENIVQPAKHNFRKYNLFSVSDFGVGYDYDSVLHYSRKAFSSNGGDTLVPKKNGADIGQRVGLSDKDTAKLNKMYCDADANNFEADEAEPNKTNIKKKKKPKNKPFEGHGIGYHKGKTVVIKLPAAETYQLPDTPSYHVFDYFSKAPQTMSPALIEGFGIGKKITYSYKLPAAFQTYLSNGPVYSNTGLTNTKPENEKNKQIEVKYLISADVDSDKSKETKESLDKIAEEEKPNSERQHFDEASDDLGEAIKSKVHPVLYMPNTDYSKFYIPDNTHPVTTRTDVYLNYSPAPQVLHDYTPKEMTSLKLTRQFIETLHEPKSKNIFEDKLNKQESLNHENQEMTLGTELVSDPELNDERRLGVKLSFGKIYPHKKLEEIKSIYSLNPEYTSFKYLKNKHDYSNFYNPNDKVKTDPGVNNAQYTTFGELVPFTAPSLQNDNEKHTPGNIHDNIRDQAFEMPRDKGFEKMVSQQETYLTETPSINYGGVTKVLEEYSSEYMEPHGSAAKNHEALKNIGNDENSSKSYEVTENINVKLDVKTETSNVDDIDQRNVKHSLADRLPEILEGYTNFDHYDIESPYAISENDSYESFGNAKSPSDNGTLPEYG